VGGHCDGIAYRVRPVTDGCLLRAIPQETRTPLQGR
jgi:hypothetical protein